MKTRYTVMASAILMGAAITASATPPSAPLAYGLGPISAAYNPGLFQSEKAAFAALEGVLQEAEANIYQGGCSAAAGTWDIDASADDTGVGSVDVTTNGTPQVHLNVFPGAVLTPATLKGKSFRVTGAFNRLKAFLPSYSSNTYYSKGGAMMVQDATFTVGNVNTLYDRLTGTVIKDFWKAPENVGGVRIPVITDWGLQSVSKNYVPQDKWWQRSHAHRSDNMDGRTVFVKDRLFSAKNGGYCRIVIDMAGFNDADGFDQTGTLVISKSTPAAFPAITQ